MTEKKKNLAPWNSLPGSAKPLDTGAPHVMTIKPQPDPKRPGSTLDVTSYEVPAKNDSTMVNPADATAPPTMGGPQTGGYATTPATKKNRIAPSSSDANPSQQ